MRSVKFGDKNSYLDFGLTTNSIEDPFPKPKTNYVGIPFGDGEIDLTEASGGIKYNNREITFRFTLQGDWPRAKNQIAAHLHGQKMEISYEADYYFLGRCSIDEYKSSANMAEIAVKAVCEPYKYHRAITVHKEVINGYMDVICINDRMPVVPTIEAASTMTISLEGKNYRAPSGIHKILDIRFKAGYNRLGVTGTGEIVFRYREGAL